MRLTSSLFSSLSQKISSLRIGVPTKVMRRLISRPGTVDKASTRAVSYVLVIAILVTSSPSAPAAIAGWARSATLVTSQNLNAYSVRLSRNLSFVLNSYVRWHKTHSSSGNTQPARAYSAPPAPMPVSPSMIPLPTDDPLVFTDDPLQAGVTVVKALHITELRAAVNQARARVGLPAATWDEAVTAGVLIKAAHILELRTRLDQARAALGLGAASYSSPAPAIGGSVRAAHIQELRDRTKELLATPTGTSSTVARLDPLNQTGGSGENPLSRNFNWSLPLLSLPGRSGLDLRIALTYNSLVWTKHGSVISFDDDGGSPTPGFRLGFPVIRPLYYNSEVGKYALLLIMPDGSRTELRQVNGSALYEAADSSHLLLDSSTMVLRTTDGSQLSYALKGADYQCTQIKDRNGNYITINYTSFDKVDTVVDTLGRVITFNYDNDHFLTSITQTWGQQSHYWARFEYYSAAEFHMDFQGLIVIGPQNYETRKLLSKVILDDDSRFEFDYTYWGQIWKIRNYAANNDLLNYRAYNLPGNWLTPQSDCPRFTTRVDWAENWNRSTATIGLSGLPAGSEQEVPTTFAVPSSTTMPNDANQAATVAQVTQPDGTYHKIYFAGTAGTAGGWKRGLAALVDTYGKTNPGDTTAVKQRQSVTTFTQDDENVSYPLNPRVTETNIYDFNGEQVQNHARTAISYQTANFNDGTSCRLPQNVYEYQPNGTTVLRHSQTDYNLAATYTDRHIIGLPGEKRLYEVDPITQAETLMSKMGFFYDESGSIQGTDAPIQHDDAHFSGNVVSGRANLSSVKRYDVSNTSQFTVSFKRYNPAGSLVSSIDPLNHETKFSYTDSFSQGGSRNALAYATTTTDPDNFAATTQYNYDFGGVTQTQKPPPQGQTVGVIKRFFYDTQARLEKVAMEFNGNQDYSHTRFEYSTSENRLDAYTTFQDGAGEAHSFQVFDGHGRAIASAVVHPGSTGGFSGQLVLYDWLGRVIKTSNATETDTQASPGGIPFQWAAKGDDETTGWRYIQQTYDWKGRPITTTNQDGTTKDTSYAGCGCAGGAVVTLTDEGTLDGGVSKRRQQKIYTDVLGRTIKKEQLNWQDGSVYSTTVNSYDARDQVTRVREYQGTDQSGIYQDTIITYDGYGRMRTKHEPEQAADLSISGSTDHTTWEYNDDDTVHRIVDGRGASQTFGYNARKLVTNIAYASPSSSTIPETAAVAFDYDNAGNRKWMTDGLGRVDYSYDALSRLTSELRHFDGLASTANGGNYNLAYEYNIGGQLKKITDSFNAEVGYTRDLAGKVTALTGAGFGNVSNYATSLQYSASGLLKHLTYGNGGSLNATYNARLQSTSFVAQGINMTYQYFDDGRVKFSENFFDHRFDRSYSYDQAGRITQALTGAEARGEAPTNNRPYKETITFDVWNNMTSRLGKHWSHNMAGFAATYVNNRMDGSQYDADGRITMSNSVNSTFDAAGRLVQTTGPQRRNNPPLSLTVGFDGDGRQAKKIQYGETIYMLYSTALNGALITEIDGTTTSQTFGQKLRGHVHVNGSELALQAPLIGDAVYLATDPSGVAENGVQLDPLGNDVGDSDPYLPDGGGDPGFNYPRYGDMFDSGFGCTVDGEPWPCTFAFKYAGVRPSTITVNGPYAWVDVRERQIISGTPLGGNSNAPSVGSDGKEAKNFSNTGGFGSAAFANFEVVWTPSHTETVWKCCDDSGNWYPEPTAYSGSQYLLAVASPQQSSYPPPRPSDKLHMLNDCRYLVAVVSEYANSYHSDTTFVKALAKRFVTPSNQDSPEMREFRADGFKTQFHDDQGSYNQVRHLVGGLSNAYYGGLAARVGFFDLPPDAAYNIAAGEALRRANAREGPEETGDRNLNGVAVPLGVQLAFGRINRSELAERIKSEVCE
jgi:YD repeat-containing protein